MTRQLVAKVRANIVTVPMRYARNKFVENDPSSLYREMNQICYSSVARLRRNFSPPLSIS